MEELVQLTKQSFCSANSYFPQIYHSCHCYKCRICVQSCWGGKLNIPARNRLLLHVPVDTDLLAYSRVPVLAEPGYTDWWPRLTWEQLLQQLLL